jgi:hypothetical protein
LPEWILRRAYRRLKTTAGRHFWWDQKMALTSRRMPEVAARGSFLFDISPDIFTFLKGTLAKRARHRQADRHPPRQARL